MTIILDDLVLGRLSEWLLAFSAGGVGMFCLLYTCGWRDQAPLGRDRR